MYGLVTCLDVSCESGQERNHLSIHCESHHLDESVVDHFTVLSSTGEALFGAFGLTDKYISSMADSRTAVS